MHKLVWLLAVGPEQVDITGLERGWVVADHKKVDITCVIHRIAPIPNVVWMINGVRRDRASRTISQLNVNNVTYDVESPMKLSVSRQSDMLTVECLVVNPSNTTDVWHTQTKQVHVYRRSFVKSPPSQLSMFCAFYVMQLACLNVD